MRAPLFVALCAAAACGRSTPPAPATDRPWVLEDFQQLARGRRCDGLPAFGSPGFARLTDPTALGRIDPAARPPEERLQTLVQFQAAANLIARRYMECSSPDAVLAANTVTFEIMVHELPILDALAATWSPTQPDHAVRVGGLEKVKKGIVGAATGAALVVRGSTFTTPLPGTGRRLGTALARARDSLGRDALAGALGNLEAPIDGDDDPNRRAIRAEIRDALAAPPP